MIVPMQFVTLVVMRDEREKVLRALQKGGCMEMVAQEGAVHASADGASELRRMEKLLTDLKPYAPKKGLFSENPQVTELEFADVQQKNQETAAHMEKLLSEIAAYRESLKQLREKTEALLPWEPLKTSVEQLQNSAYTRYVTGVLPKKQLDVFTEAVHADGGAVEQISETPVACYVVLALFAENTLSDLSPFGFESIQIPLDSGTPADALNICRTQLESVSALLETAQAELKQLADESHAPQLLCEQYRAQSDLESTPFLETDQTALLEGWVEKERLEQLESLVKSVTDVYVLSARDPEPDEEVPTLLKNNKTTSQFEGITNMFSVPHYGGYDPNAVMAPWYWVIFGMMMGDAGYGLMMVVLISAVKKLMKPKGDTKKLINVLLYSSVTTIICGVLFGSYFGETWHPILFSPLEDPVKMLIVTLGIGVAHIFTGLIVQIVNNIKAGHVLDALFDQVSWMLVIGGICLFFLPAVRTVGIVLAAVGAVTILCTAGRAKKGVVGKITGGLVGLYGITNYLSDILSYSRILALSLATGVVGMVMNMLAGMIQGSVIGFILSLLIYIVGHVFNLVLGLLSAYVHDCRLQYIEFYGKFYEGSGKLFTPLSIHPKYIQIHENGGK